MESRAWSLGSVYREGREKKKKSLNSYFIIKCNSIIEERGKQYGKIKNRDGRGKHEKMNRPSTRGSESPSGEPLNKTKMRDAMCESDT